MGMFDAGPEASVACPVSLSVGEVIVWLALVAPLVDAPLRAELEAVSVVLGWDVAESPAFLFEADIPPHFLNQSIFILF